MAKPMKLTNPAAWHVFAGGTAAASNRYSYSAYTTIGRYQIQPVSHKHNVNKHLGYGVHFINEKGALPGGLYQCIWSTAILPAARRMCQEHMAKHNGSLVPEQIPGAAS